MTARPPAAQPRLMSRSRLAVRPVEVGLWLLAALPAVLLVWILFDVLRAGLPLVSWDYLTSLPSSAGRAGGILPVLVSTGLILAVCLAASLPLGLGTAVLLAEFVPRHSWPGRLIRISLDILAGVPSIVFGLFGNALFCRLLGLRFSILSGGLTLACMALPLWIRAAQESVQSVPAEYRQGGLALGMSRGATLWKLVLPSALPGLAAGLVLAIGRALAETAALIFTSGYVDRMPHSLHDSGRSLSIHIYDLAMNVAGGNPRASAAATVLVLALLLINFLSRWLLALTFGGSSTGTRRPAPA